MSTSVGTKAKKKQSTSLKKPTPPPARPASPQADKALEMAMLTLETICLMVLESDFSPTPEEEGALAARQRFINAVTPVSLALMECKGGPRHFHQHYRHKPEDETILQPILEDPVANLALACREASKHCHEELLGLRDPDLRHARQAFQQAIQSFLSLHEA